MPVSATRGGIAGAFLASGTANGATSEPQSAASARRRLRIRPKVMAVSVGPRGEECRARRGRRIVESAVRKHDPCALQLYFLFFDAVGAVMNGQGTRRV